MKIKLIIAVIAILWVGMILAIGMESIVKFNAPTLTKPVAFDVGRTVFGAFNKIQLMMLIMMMIGAIFAHLSLIDKSLMAMVFLILMVQIFGLFPILSQRVDLILSGTQPAPTYLHGLYGVLEIIKLVSLFVFGLKLIMR